MAKKRPTLEDDAQLDELFPTARTKGKKRREPSPSQIKYPHSTYRLFPGQHDEVKEIAGDLGLDLNELVRFMFADYINRYKNGRLDLPIRKEEKTVKVVNLVYPE